MTFRVTNNELGCLSPRFVYPWKRQQEEGLKQQKSDHSGCSNEHFRFVVELKVISHMMSQIFLSVYISV